nr:hypothetical protein [Olsenella intestinalis]
MITSAWQTASARPAVSMWGATTFVPASPRRAATSAEIASRRPASVSPWSGLVTTTRSSWGSASRFATIR